MPWYSAVDSLDTLLVGCHIGMEHLTCYVRDGDRVFETYWTTDRGVEIVDNSYSLMDLTVFGRQEQHVLSEAATILGWRPSIGFLEFMRDLRDRDARGEDVSKLRVPGELRAATP